MTEDVRPSSTDPSEQASFSTMEESQDAYANRRPTQAQPAQPPPPTTPAKRNSVASSDHNDSIPPATGPPLPQSRPISQVVTDAIQDSPATHQVDSELIKMISAQVTEAVMKNLAQQQASSPTIAAPLPTRSSQTVYPPPPQVSSPDSNDTAHQMFTPPPPERYSPSIGDRVVTSPSPDIAQSDSDSRFSRRSGESLRSSESIRSEEMPRAAKTDSSSTMRKRSPANIGTRMHPRESEIAKAARDQERLRRDSKTSEAAYDGPPQTNAAPHAEPLDDGRTVIEKMWQPLFVDSNPTDRLGQFLRGLALHLIDDYEPMCSLVVTPHKMLRFFNETKVEEELYPWDVIFGGKMAFASLSVMYRKLVCEHHLIQTHRQDLPTIPGLTPHGFQEFMTCLIQAHPNTEFERLAQAVTNMPISNADNKTERFPKELSRRLLPSEGSIQAEQRLVSSLNHEPYVLGEVKTSTAMPPPPPPSSAPPVNRNQQSFSERTRQPYSQAAQHSSVIDDDDLVPAQLPIERERKPYYAKEGTGRKYTSDESRSQSTQYRPEPTGIRAERANSNVPQPPWPPGAAQSEPMNIPTRMPHRQSFGQPNMIPPGLNGGYSKSRGGRGSSPPPRNVFTRSGGDLSETTSVPNQPFGSNLHPVQSSPVVSDFDEDKFTRFPGRPTRGDRSSAASAANDDTSSSRSFNRSTQNANIYDYGGPGGPVGGQPPPPMASSYSTRPMGPPPHSEEDRRRSVAAPAYGYQSGSDGGTDGYGSFADRSKQQPYGSSSQY